MWFSCSIELYACYRLIDNLPAATAFKNINTKELQYEDGFKLGFVVEGKVSCVCRCVRARARTHLLLLLNKLWCSFYLCKILNV